MAGSKQKKSFSFFSFFKANKGPGNSPADESWRGRKVYPSDEDSIRRVVAEPRINEKASVYIDNFHATRVSEALTKHAEN
ncbi:hypothetical protein PTKIN_Ptkin01aG0300900 [Pterospermum kingtungense]